MNPNRMTENELNELNPSVDNPIELECDSGAYVNVLQKIKVLSKSHRGHVFIENAEGKAKRLSVGELKHYPSKKEQPKVETLYECMGGTGFTRWIFGDGTHPKFLTKEKSNKKDMVRLKRKTGRTLEINMDTFEILGGER